MGKKVLGKELLKGNVIAQPKELIRIKRS